MARGLGLVLYEVDRYDEARETFRRLANLKPERGPAWAVLGLCEFELRDYEQALEHLRRVETAGVGNNSELRSGGISFGHPVYTLRTI